MAIREAKKQHDIYIT